ncbi:hypothetical protein KPL71_011701 [Citrus sinensis]|uniref:Uncharacterized protein n=1 Tax=Citrus sinensis TaxID=2711 RepID=A0ACB8L5I2_CITSI|nr:hypothetical protein KPL71_011701 [Citrus sinensis]
MVVTEKCDVYNFKVVALEALMGKQLAYTMVVTEKCDVYNFKVVALEALMGKQLAYTMVVTEKCDVYNFKVVALEALMGKHAGELLSLSSSSLDTNIKLIDLLDTRLSPLVDQMIRQDIYLVSTVAFSCLRSQPILSCN